MGSRVFRRRAATAVATYGATALGIVTVAAATRLLGDYRFGLFAIVLAAVAFFQLLADSTVEEAVVKYGFRYVAEERWGRLRRLFAVALAAKWAGAAAAAVLVAVLAPFADGIFNADGLRTPMLLGALVPLVQAPEAVAGAALLVRGRYDLRAWFFVVSMVLRLAGVGIGASFGVPEAVIGYVVAQALASSAIGAVALASLRRFPAAAPERLAEDARGIRRFVASSAAGSGLVSLRTTFATLGLGVVSNPFQVGYFRPHLTGKNLGGLSLYLNGLERGRYVPGSRIELVEGSHQLEIRGNQLKKPVPVEVRITAGQTVEGKPLDITPFID